MPRLTRLPFLIAVILSLSAFADQESNLKEAKNAAEQARRIATEDMAYHRLTDHPAFNFAEGLIQTPDQMEKVGRIETAIDLYYQAAQIFSQIPIAPPSITSATKGGGIEDPVGAEERQPIKPPVLGLDIFGIRLGESISEVQKVCKNAGIEVLESDAEIIKLNRRFQIPISMWEIDGALNGDPKIKKMILNTHDGFIFQIRILLNDNSDRNFQAIKELMDKEYTADIHPYSDSNDPKGPMNDYGYITEGEGHKIAILPSRYSIPTPEGDLQEPTIQIAYIHTEFKDSIPFEEYRQVWDNQPSNGLFQIHETIEGKVISIIDSKSIIIANEKERSVVCLDGIVTIDSVLKSESTATREFISEQCFGKNVKVFISQRGKDGDIFGYVVLPDGYTLAERMVESGYAVPQKGSECYEVLWSKKEEAEKNARGLWRKVEDTLEAIDNYEEPLHEGGTAYLKYPFVARYLSALKEFLIVVHNHEAVQILCDRGDVIITEDNAKVIVLSIHKEDFQTMVEIRILEGSYKGTSGWVRDYCLSTKKPSE